MAGKKSRSRSRKASLQIPVGRIARYLKVGRYAKRVGVGAPVFLATVLEYLVDEVLELTEDVAGDNKKARITPRHIQLVVLNDDELNMVFRDVTIAYGGVREHIYNVLVPRKKADAATKEEEKEN